jgi:hypothetical protein
MNRKKNCRPMNLMRLMNLNPTTAMTALNMVMRSRLKRILLK